MPNLRDDSTHTQPLAELARQIPFVQWLKCTVLRGPDKGHTAALDIDPIRIGTQEGCELKLQDPSVSGLHVELKRTPQGLLIKDMNSLNGTHLDGRRIVALYSDAAVTLSLGKTDVHIEFLPQESPVALTQDESFGDLAGSTPVMRALFFKLQKLAASETTVLVTGETGTGKELVASALHTHSPRAEGPLVVVDCGALPANLIESELFGHVRGAFTGAHKDRPGAFERASGGTLFLDEVGELPLELQPALLGALERRRVSRVGASGSIAVDCRIVAATNRELSQEVGRGAFRADLYYRLAVVEIRIPPLRERLADLPLLVAKLWGQVGGRPGNVPTKLIETFRNHSWPGNIRELRNVLERHAVLAEHVEFNAPEPVLENDLITYRMDVTAPFKEQRQKLLAAFESTFVSRLLETTSGNITTAAERARVDRMLLYRMINRYSLEIPNRP